eukprot:bmy_07367T0
MRNRWREEELPDLRQCPSPPPRGDSTQGSADDEKRQREKVKADFLAVVYFWTLYNSTFCCGSLRKEYLESTSFLKLDRPSVLSRSFDVKLLSEDGTVIPVPLFIGEHYCLIKTGAWASAYGELSSPRRPHLPTASYGVGSRTVVLKSEIELAPLPLLSLPPSFRRNVANHSPALSRSPRRPSSSSSVARRRHRASSLRQAGQCAAAVEPRKDCGSQPHDRPSIPSLPYFKVQLYELKTYHEVVDEIYFKVTHAEPWAKGSRKTAGQTGMCGGVLGVRTEGIDSTAFCLLYRLFTLKLTRKQVMGLTTHTDSPYIRALGFMYIRYTQPPTDLWDWFESFLDAEEDLDVKAGGGCVMTIGEMLWSLLTKLEWCSTLFPRIPVPGQKNIDQQIKTRPRKIKKDGKESAEEIDMLNAGVQGLQGDH